MAETKHNAPPPVPAAMLIDGAIAVRSPDESSEESACFVLGHMLTLKVCDVRTGRPLRQGGYVKSCRITVDGSADTYECPDADRHPPAARTVAIYAGDNAKINAQKARFYRWVSSSLKRLGYYKGDQTGVFSAALGEAMKLFYEGAASKTVANISECFDDFHGYLGAALAGRDQVDSNGCVAIGLPEVAARKKVKIRVEFHDLKFITKDDVKTAAEAAWGRCDGDAAKLTPSTLPGMAVAYDRAAAQWPSGGADPDHMDHESSKEKSNWFVGVERLGGGTHKANFRNFHEWEITLDHTQPVQAQETIFALTWCQPVWHEDLAVAREGFELSQFHGPPSKRTEPAINTLHRRNGPSAHNYPVFGIFRNTGKYFRLHTGVDLSGRCREEGGHKRTPVFAINGGRATKYGNNIRLNHRDEQVTRYVHMFAADLMAASNRWAKAGTLLGKMGRHEIDNSYPTHCHFETLVADETGWGHNKFSELPNGAAKVARYPRDPGVDASTEKPKYINYQYGAWTREPGAMLEKWINRQLGDGSFAQYRSCMPASWPALYTPPCRCEFDEKHTSNPTGCQARCVTGSDQPVADQVKWVRDCWAIRTSHDPAHCACPGLSARGLAKSFTRIQRIQYHLWQLGIYGPGALFDGTLSHGTLRALEEGLPTIDSECERETGLGSAFVADVAREAQALVRRQAASKKVDASTITETPEHRRIAAGNVLKVAGKIDLLLEELQRIAPHT